MQGTESRSKSLQVQCLRYTVFFTFLSTIRRWVMDPVGFSNLGSLHETLVYYMHVFLFIA